MLVEWRDEGVDTVRSARDGMLDVYLENLTLTGTCAIDATGNGCANVIAGNAAANLLDGNGGNDTLTGNGGQDTFIFTSTSWSATITGFLCGTDKMRFSKSNMPVRDGDTAVDGTRTISGPGGISSFAGLVPAARSVTDHSSAPRAANWSRRQYPARAIVAAIS